MTDPARPEAPEREGWHPDPWGDGQRYWDGEIWTRRTRVPPHSTELLGGRVAAAEPPEVGEPGVGPDSDDEDDARTEPPGPRDWVEPEEPEDDRPLRSGLQRGMIWAFALVALIALVTTAVAIWPAVFASGR